MAGHSKFKNIQHRKGAQDRKRAKIFTRILREVSIAAKDNQIINENPKLRKAVLMARSANIPNDKIEHAIHKESKKDLSSYSDIQYEAFLPGGIGFIIEISTDNRNRSSGEVRAVLSKHGATMVETGNVSFSFDKLGVITFDKLDSNQIESLMNLDILDIIDEVQEMDVDDDDTSIERTIILVKLEKFHEILENLQSPDFKSLPPIIESEIRWIPQNKLEINEDQKKLVQKLSNALDDLDDVTSVFCNV